MFIHPRVLGIPTIVFNKNSTLKQSNTLNSENKGLWYQQNQKARERASEAKRTGEKEDTILKKKKIQ